MGEEGSEEEVERSFEEEFASVIAPGEGLEEVLKSLDEELQEGNWKTRLRKEEVASKRAVLQRARAVLESAVKSREGLPVLDPGSSAKKRQARRFAELAASADAEAKLEEAESLISVLQAEFEQSLAEAAGAEEEKKEEADGRAGSVAADPVTAATEVKEVKEAALGRFLLFLKEELAVPAEFLDRPDFREATETAFGQVEKVAGDVIEEARELYSDLAAELEVVQQQLEEETRRANTELYARIEAEAELAGLQAQAGPGPEAEAVRRAELETAKEALAAKDLEIVQARQEGALASAAEVSALRAELAVQVAAVAASKGSSGESKADGAVSGGFEESAAAVRPVRDEQAWQRPRRLVEAYTTALIEGSLYYNSVQLWRRTAPVNSSLREGELLETYPILGPANCENAHFEELEFSLPVAVGLQDVLRHVQLGGRISNGSPAHSLLEELQDLHVTRASFLLELAEATRDQGMRHDQASAGGVAALLATQSPAEIRSTYNYNKTLAQSSTVIPESDQQRLEREERRVRAQGIFTTQLIKEETKFHVQQVLAASRQQRGGARWQTGRGSPHRGRGGRGDPGARRGQAQRGPGAPAPAPAAS